MTGTQKEWFHGLSRMQGGKPGRQEVLRRMRLGIGGKAGACPGGGEDGAWYCGKHTKAVTRLRCGRCETPICPKCTVYTPAGTRCRPCAKNKIAIRPAGLLHGAVGTLSNTRVRAGPAHLVSGLVVGRAFLRPQHHRPVFPKWRMVTLCCEITPNPPNSKTKKREPLWLSLVFVASNSSQQCIYYITTEAVCQAAFFRPTLLRNASGSNNRHRL